MRIRLLAAVTGAASILAGSAPAAEAPSPEALAWATAQTVAAFDYCAPEKRESLHYQAISAEAVAAGWPAFQARNVKTDPWLVSVRTLSGNEKTSPSVTLMVRTMGSPGELLYECEIVSRPGVLPGLKAELERRYGPKADMSELRQVGRTVRPATLEEMLAAEDLKGSVAKLGADERIVFIMSGEKDGRSVVKVGIWARQ